MRRFALAALALLACVTSAVRHFRSEFEAGRATPAWELFPYGRSALFEVQEKVEVHA